MGWQEVKQLQSRTKIAQTLPPNTVFSLLACLLILPTLFVAINSPHLVHEHWEGKMTIKRLIILTEYVASFIDLI